MSTYRFLLYQNVLKHAASKASVTVPIPGTPPLYMLIECDFRGLYLLGPFTESCGRLVGAFDTIQVSKVEHWGNQLLKVGTDNADHFQQMLALLCDIADLVHAENRSFTDAVSEAASRWRALLAPSSVLSDNAERGLLGELWLLERIIGIYGPEGLDTWQGPKRELHDFSIGDRAYEVKTTLARERIHTISDLRQLQPRAEADLYILSLQFQPDGDPSSGNLSRAVDAIHDLLRTDSHRLGLFGELLRKVGYDERHRDRYETRYKLRTKPTLTKVDEHFPALTPSHLERALGPEVSARIVDVKYSVSLENLGHEDGSRVFLDLLPWIPSIVLP
jgi:hypothetical protein